MPATLASLGVLTLLAIAAAAALWPAADADVVEHVHAELRPDHPHLEGTGSRRHAHAFVIDDLHRRWPAMRPG